MNKEKRKHIFVFADKCRFAGGEYIARGIELNLRIGRFRIGHMQLLNGAKAKSFAYFGNRHTWSWTARVWNFAFSYLHNYEP
jgi:hypothetical protein